MNNQSYLVVDISSKLKEFIQNYISFHLQKENPYICEPETIEKFSIEVKRFLKEGLQKRTVTKDVFLTLLSDVERGAVLPAVVFGNLPTENKTSLLEPSKNRGYEYGENPHDRLKEGFVTEWVCWLFARLLGYDAVIHPSEHGGNNRFHLISPIPHKDSALRETGASTGGGTFPQHSDATVFTEVTTKEQLNLRLNIYSTDLNTISEKLQKSHAQILSEVLCKQFTKVDATFLKGILNVKCVTHIVAPQNLEAQLRTFDFSSEDFYSLSKMPIAHIAGPADGEISGYVGEITQPVFLNRSGRLVGTCINTADGRMIYVGKSKEDERLFEKFVRCIQSMEPEKIFLDSDNLIYIPNRYDGIQPNYTHGRERLDDAEYRISIGEGKYSRRMHCRQYTVKRPEKDLSPGGVLLND